MADEKREHEYDVAIKLAQCVSGQLFDKQYKPDAMNPIRNDRRAKRVRTPEEIKADTKEALRLLRVALVALNKNKGK